MFARASPLRVGAAKVDVTPADSALPKNYLGVLDRLYARAIVLDNGAARAALITVDAGGLSDAIWQAVTRQVETELRIPSANVLLTATHTHSVPGPPAADYAQKIVDAVRRAQQKLTPARVGYGTGESYINVNRQITDPKTGKWWEGPNREGPSDKTVAVLKFESLSGEPLAVYYNYAVHGVIAGQLDQVSGDIPGASSRYIEDSFGGSVVAVWSTRRGGRPESDLLPADLRPARDPHQGLREARRRHQQRDAARRTGPGPERSRGGAADEPAAADGVVDGAVPRRRSAARHAEHRTDRHGRSPVRQSEDDQLSRPRADERGPRRVRRHLQGRRGRWRSGWDCCAWATP